MAKKNLKNALAKQQTKAAATAKIKKAEDAAERKAASMRASAAGGGAPKKRKVEKTAPISGVAPKEGLQEEGEESTEVADDAQNVPKGKRKAKIVQPFERDDTILLIGEGNFSFARALLSPPHSHPPHLVLATAYDTEAECYSKYPDAAEHVAAIRAIAGRDDVVAFGVDAGNLSANRAVTGLAKGRKADSEDKGRKYSKIWWGFPHVGAGHKDETRNVLANQLQILRFLVSAAPLLTRGPNPSYAKAAASQAGKKRKSRKDDDDDDEPDEPASTGGPQDEVTDEEFEDETGEVQPILPSASFRAPARSGSIQITLRNAKPYTLWDVATLAKRLPSMLGAIAPSAPSLPRGQKAPSLLDVRQAFGTRRYALWRSFVFDPAAWPGYEHRRTVGWVPGLSTGDNEDLLKSAGGSVAHGVKASKAGAGECRTWEFGTESSVHDESGKKAKGRASAGK